MRGLIAEPNWLNAIRKGNVKNHITSTLIAHSDNVGTSHTTVWDISGSPEYSFPAAAATMTISSSSSNDTSAGTGARSVYIEYLDSDYVAQTQTATMNGQSGVTLSGSILRINNIRVISSGSGQKNAGDIWIGTGSITSGVPANKYGYIATGDSIMRTGIFTVPAEKELVFEALNFSSYSTKFQEVLIEVLVYGTNTWLVTSEYHLYQSSLGLNNLAARPIPAKADIRIRAKVDTGAGSLSAIIGYSLCAASENNKFYP